MAGNGRTMWHTPDYINAEHGPYEQNGRISLAEGNILEYHIYKSNLLMVYVYLAVCKCLC